MRWLFDRLGLKRRDNEDGWIVKGLPHDIKLEPFGVTAFATALKAADLIADKWDECIGSGQMSASANWILRVEELAYVLHIINRVSFRFGGESLRDRFQDYYTITLCHSLVANSWHPSPAARKAADSSFLTRLFNETLDNLGSCESEFAKSRRFFIEPQVVKRPDGAGVFLIPEEDDVVNALSTMIAHDTNVELNPALHQLIWISNVNAFTESGFTQHHSTTIKLALSKDST